jgi:DNA repair photolyase
MLNRISGNMYNWVTHTFNIIRGKCHHDCSYCYLKRFPQTDLRFAEKELKTDLGENNFIFVGSSCDMFAESIPEDWIIKTLQYCAKYPKNKYLFQSKNPSKLYRFRDYIPDGSIVGTTIETNREYKVSVAPDFQDRAYFLGQFDSNKFKRMVTIEPILDFDLNELVPLIKMCRPDWVNIGADSKGHNLPEPSKEKVEALIGELKKFTEVKKKSNLQRLL